MGITYIHSIWLKELCESFFCRNRNFVTQKVFHCQIQMLAPSLEHLLKTHRLSWCLGLEPLFSPIPNSLIFLMHYCWLRTLDRKRWYLRRKIAMIFTSYCPNFCPCFDLCEKELLTNAYVVFPFWSDFYIKGRRKHMESKRWLFFFELLWQK